MNINYYDEIFSELRRMNYASTNDLKKLSLTYNDINNLLDKGYLNRVTRGYYKVNVTGKDFCIKDSIIKKANEAIRNRDLDEALLIMSKYPFFDISSRAHYLLFKIYLLKDDFENAKYQLLEAIKLSKQKDEIRDMYLLMLNKLIEKDEMIKKLIL